jgi:hypothetical protein
MFRTELNIDPSLIKIGHYDPILTLGSCFSDSMGARLASNKFEVKYNPFGTVYNPISIFKLLQYSLSNEMPNESSYLENDGLFANYDFHSSFSALNKSSIKKQIEEQIESTNTFLKSAKWLILTLGTAYVYKRKDTKEIVSNCHKIPGKNFTKRLLTQKQILEAFDQLWKQLATLNPGLKILLTVSPVRHIKDTLALNSVSKSTLRLTSDTLANQYEHVSYFPSYELMMDDLRDYRFYKADMIHPTEEAEDYIWEKFASAYFGKSTLDFLSEWSKIRAAIQHRPFNTTSEKHQAFIKSTIQKIKSLDNKLDFSEELKVLEGQLV